MKPPLWISALLMVGLLAVCRLSADDPLPPKLKMTAEPTKSADETREVLLWDGAAMVAKQAAGAAGEKPLLIRPAPMRVSLDVLMGGKELPIVSHAGKSYLPIPRVGAEYTIRVWNHGPQRVVAIVSVDGLSVINGQPASENHPGYIVAPYSSIAIKGWRRTTDTVAAFRFVEGDRSYANLVGQSDNIGVIGLIAIEELAPQPAELERRDAAVPAQALRGEVGSIGTEYGREIDSRICYVLFVRSAHRQTISLYYDTADALRAAGVPIDRPMPVPFPGNSKFVPPPPGYKRS